MAKLLGRSRWVGLDGVSPWEPTPVEPPGRICRDLGVAGQAPLVLYVEPEPFFEDVGSAAAQLRAVLVRFGATDAVVHSRLLGRHARTGEPAEQWLTQCAAHHAWWPQDVTWRSPDPGGLRVLAVPSGNYEEITLMAWGPDAERFLDEVAAGWAALPKHH